MVSALVSELSSPGLSSDLAGDIVLCSWAGHFTFTVPLSIQVYEWALLNVMVNVAL